MGDPIIELYKNWKLISFDIEADFAEKNVTELHDKVKRLLVQQRDDANLIHDSKGGEVGYSKIPTISGIELYVQYNPMRAQRMGGINLNWAEHSIENASGSSPELQNLKDTLSALTQKRNAQKEEFRLNTGEDRCFLCSEFMPLVEKGFGFHDFNVWPNPFPIFNGHLTLGYKEHIPQTLTVGGLEMALDFVLQAPGYRVFYNGLQAGASIPKHYHFQAFPVTSLPNEMGLPIELYPLINVGETSGVRVFETEGYPCHVTVLSSPDTTSLAAQVLDRYSKLRMAGDSLNLLFSHVKGRFMAYIIPRSKGNETPSAFFGNKFGAIEMAGIIISTDPDEKEALKRMGNIEGGDMKNTYKKEVVDAIKTAGSMIEI